MAQQYKEHLSDYKTWDQPDHAHEWMLFPENIGSHLSIDETSLSNGELYTILTNKAAKGKKGSIVAMIEGTQSEKAIEIISQVSQELREQVQEITLDTAGSMNRIVTWCFLNASYVIDRFHVQKLTYDALQEMLITHRWDAITEETNAIENAKLYNVRYIPEILSNGNPKKQLLARSRYLLFQSAEKWTNQQKQRAKILFEIYPDIKNIRTHLFS